jgi:2-polyprenyl-3-methyl-5-hydroxy-6-metoxy-1,4-benzoquinol methylase
MEFTGERVVPGKVGSDLFNEHLARYYFAQPLMDQRLVLDLGCGSGYGAAILARSARTVVGMDISNEAVDFARRNFAASNLGFFVGNCSCIALASASVDAVVCFEVIEQPDGFLIISTPNRIYYTEERKESNPFHVHEFNFAEFVAILEGTFEKVGVFYQNHCFAIFVGHPNLPRGV